MSFNYIWSPELCLILIEEYRQQSILWDVQNRFHYNKRKKQEAWEIIAHNLNIDVENIKHKINSVLAAFRRERSKFRKANADKPYASQWYAFKALQFLFNDEDYNKLNLNKNVVNEQNNINFKDSAIIETNDPLNNYDQPENLVEEQIEEASSEYNENKKFKPNEIIENIETEHFVDENHEQTYVVEPILNDDNLYIWKEECNAFGQFVANKLLQYNLRTRAIAEHAISNVIFEADIGKYNNVASASSINLSLSHSNLECTWLKRKSTS